MVFLHILETTEADEEFSSEVDTCPTLLLTRDDGGARGNDCACVRALSLGPVAFCGLVA